MKRVLLSCAFIVTVLSSKAQQQLDAGFNFESGFPASWVVTDGITVGDYDCNATTNNGLLIPVPRQNGHATIQTNTFIPSAQSPRITVFFDLFAKNTALDCNNLANLTCDVTAKLYLVSPSYSGVGTPPQAQILAESPITTVAPNVTGVVLSADLSSASQFKVVIEGKTQNCTNQEILTYVIDNILIAEVDRAVLPVSFKSFTAERKGSEVTLNWTTASEQNNKGFFIERNVNGEWKNAGFVASKANSGNSSSDLLYTFSHTNNAKGISEYRLMQVDIDGKAKYSEIRSVRGEGAASRIVVYPNPSSIGAVTVMFNDLHAKDVQVTDISGRVLSRYNNVINNIEIKNLKAGMYTISVSDRQSGVKSILKAIVQ